MNRGLPFHRGVGESATPFPGLLHFILDPHLIMLSVKQDGIEYHFLIFGMTRPGIEPRSSGQIMHKYENLLQAKQVQKFKDTDVIVFNLDFNKCFCCCYCCFLGFCFVFGFVFCFFVLGGFFVVFF